MRSKRIISALTALMLSAAMMTGCGERPAEDAPSAADKDSKSTTTTAAETEKAAEEKPAETTETAPEDKPATEDEDQLAEVVELTSGEDSMIPGMKLTSLSSMNRLSDAAVDYSSMGIRMADNASTDRKWSDKKPEKKKKMTIMVYMVGSDLESDQAGMNATRDVVEMVNSGLDDTDVNLVIYCGGAKTWWLNGFPTGKNAYLEYKSKGADVLGDSDGGINFYADDKKNMGSADTFSDFLKEVPEKYPADEFALICWDHGAGPVLGYGMDELNTDAKTGLGDTLTMAEMRKALDKSQFKDKKLAFVGFDACLMSSIEIADLWQPYANYLVASADVEPGCGWDYSFLGDVKGGSKTTDICSNIIKSYFDFLSKLSSQVYISGATLGTFDLSKTDAVKGAMGGVCKAMKTDIDKGDYSNYEKFTDGVHSYASYDLADLGTMVTSLSGSYKGETDKLKSAVGDMLVDGTTTIKNTCGLTVYFPLTNSAADYEMSNIMFNLGGNDLISNDPIDKDYQALMGTLFEGVEAGSGSTDESSKPDESSSSKAEESSSSQAESSSSKAEESSSSQAESSSSKGEESSSSQAESSSSEADTSSKPDDSSKPENKPSSDGGIYGDLEIEVVPKGEKSSNKKFKDDGYAYAQLTDEQIKNARGVYYTVLTNVSTDEKSKSWTPKLLYVPAEVDKDGVVKMDLDPMSIGVVTDKEAEPISCLTKFMGKGTYRSSGTLCADEQLSDERMNVTIESVVDDKGNASITGISADKTTEGGVPVASKEDIDLSEWMSFSSSFVGFKPDDKHPRTHYSELEQSEFGSEFISVGESFDVKAFNLSDMPAEYAIQMSVFTYDGKEYCSPIGDYEFKDTAAEKLKEEKIDNGTLKFAIADDHAELVSYESKDAEKDGKIEIPEKVDGKSVTVIRSYSFDGAQPTEIVFPDSVETMGILSRTLQTKLTGITLSKNLKAIPERAFGNASALESITLPDSLESIGSFAFSHTALKEINIPKNVTVIDAGAFSDCAKLEKMTVDKDNKTYAAKDNVLYTADMKKLVCFPGRSRTEFTIPEGVEEIGPYAFVGSYEPGFSIGTEEAAGEGLTKITFAKSVKKISDFAFRDCLGFKEIVLPDSLEYIGTGAFGASFMYTAQVELTELKIGENVKRIRGYAFTGYTAKKIAVDEKNCYFKTDGKKLTSIDGSAEIVVFAK